jgi:predicted TIM-barrel fold metal-dependent hydrolase
VSIRNGPVFTREGTKSPADPLFDPFWARVAEAGVVVAPHAGFEDGYVGVTRAVAEEWGRSPTATGAGDAVDQYAGVISMLMKHRLVRDFAAILVADKLFERHAGVRVAYIENGATWVGELLHGLQMLHGQNPGMFQRNPVDQFIENCWVAPFVEDSVPDLAEHLPVERILFGSDWPHAEGLAHPRDFFKNVEEFSLDDQYKIMQGNARQLTFALPSD